MDTILAQICMNLVTCVNTLYTLWAIKNVALYFCPYLQQLLTDVKNLFSGTLCGQFAIIM